MTPEKRLTQLIGEGAVIAIMDPEVEITLAGALWVKEPDALRWVGVFPEHQGHIHETEYDEARLANDGRDVLLYKDGALVAGIVPYLESTLPSDDVREALAEWQAQLSTFGNAEEFAGFLQNA